MRKNKDLDFSFGLNVQHVQKVPKYRINDQIKNIDLEEDIKPK